MHICSIMSQNENHNASEDVSEDVSSLHVALCMLSFKKIHFLLPSLLGISSDLSWGGYGYFLKSHMYYTCIIRTHSHICCFISTEATLQMSTTSKLSKLVYYTYSIQGLK